MVQEYVKISELEPTTSFGTADQFVIVQDEETVKIDGASLAESLATLTNLATRSYVDAVVDSAPGTLDTLRELAAALNDDENFASNIVGLINEKLPTGNFGLEFWNQLATVNTYHIQEGSNLYWTQERFDSALASKNTYHLVEGSNLYFTEQRVLDVVTPLVPTSIFDLGVPEVGTPENIPGYLYYNGTDLSWRAPEELEDFSGDYNDLVNAPDLTVYQLASTAFSGDYNDLINTPAPYSLPTASTSVLGGVKVDGSTIVIDSYGTITAVGSGAMSPDPVFNSVTTTQLNVQNITFTGTGAVNIFSGNDLNLSAVGNVTVNGQNFVAFSGNYNDLIDKPTNPTYNSVIVSGPITNPSHATTKAYVDWKVSSIPTPSWNSLVNISNNLGPTRIALGRNAGGVSDADGYGGYGGYGAYGGSSYAIAIGNSSGKTNQGGAAVAVGVATGYTDQGENAVAIGFTAGNVYQGTAAVAVGPSAGNVYQGVNAVAVGNLAGYSSQGTNAIAIGSLAGRVNQPANSIVISASGNELNGTTAGLYIDPIRSADTTDYVAYYNPETKEVTYGPAPSGGGAMSPDPVFNSVTATDLNVQNVNFTGTGAVTINSNNDLNFAAAGDIRFNGEQLSTVATSGSYGDLTGKPTLFSGSYNDLTNKDGANGPSRIAIGKRAGGGTPSQYGVAIGEDAGEYNQGANAVAIGIASGATSQGNYSISVGGSAGMRNQGTQSIAVGNAAGESNQGYTGVAIGTQAGWDSQGYQSVAIGTQAGKDSQGILSVAIGTYAGKFNQGQYAVAIGPQAGESGQPHNTIIINATELAVNGEGEPFRFYVAPIRDTTATAKGMFYNTTTKEVTTATLAAVATSGSYNDLTNKPTPNYVQADKASTSMPYGTALPATVVSGTITTTGGPVRLHISGNCTVNTGGAPVIQFQRGTTGVGRNMTLTNNGSNLSFASECIDAVPAGTYTYSVKVVSGSIGNGAIFYDPVLTIIELK